jgi:regulator of sirC expression with transglutaminase-like and TPR domain
MDPAARFATLVTGPPDALELDRACALMAAAFTGTYRYDEVMRQLDHLAGLCTESSMRGILSVMRGRLSGNREHYYEPENSYLDVVLERGTGLPITLSVAAIEIGRRLDVPIVGIGLPGHFLIRQAPHDVYGDPFNAGAVYDRAGIVSSWHRIVSVEHPFDEMHLRPVDTRGILIRMLNNLRALLLPRSEPRAMYALATMRGAFVELVEEAPQHRQWVRSLN